MTKADLVEEVAKAADMTKKDSEQLVELVFDSIIESLKRGEKITDGTIAEVAARFSNGEPNVNLEEVFIRATGGTEN